MTDIFISYSHQDEKWKDALQKQLRVLQLHADFMVWDDRQIEIGDNWLPRIEEAIAAAKVAILLISSDFLISEFVSRQEIPRFLQRRAADGLRVVPLVVEPCPWQAVGWLASLQGATKDNEALSRHVWDSYALKQELSQVALKVYALLQESRAEAERQLAAQHAEQARQAQRAREREQARLEAEQRAEQARLQNIADEQARQAQMAREAKRQQDLAAAAEAKQQAPPRPQAVLDVQQAPLGLSSPLKLSKWVLLLAGLGLAAWGVSAYRSAPVQPKPLTQEPVSLAPTAPAPATPEPSEANTQLPIPKMLPIPAGEFTMGCVKERDEVEGGCLDWEKPPHPVKLSAFKLAETEVTVEQYLACVQQGGCPAPYWNEKGSDYNISTGKDEHYKKMGKALTDSQHPIVGVSWENAVAYVAWLNKSQQPSQPFRLPTEAEWEYAARGGDNEQAYPWGNKASHEFANYGKNECCEGLVSGKDQWLYTAPVGSFAPNGFGLKDMHGNVWEWVADWHGAYPDQSASNPKGASKGTLRVLRGGSWSNTPRYVRSADRGNLTPDDRDYNTGFRVAQDQ